MSPSDNSSRDTAALTNARAQEGFLLLWGPLLLCQTSSFTRIDVIEKVISMGWVDSLVDKVFNQREDLSSDL